jgi:hypothetical protein
MAARNRPSFLKNLKEQQRRARAEAKRQERRSRKLNRAEAEGDEDPTADVESLDAPLEDAETTEES